MQVEQNIGLSGKVGWEIINSDGSTHLSSNGMYKNLILNNGLDKLGATGGANQGEGLSIANVFEYCAVGISNATPDVLQNGFMSTEVARTNNYLISAGGCGTNYPNAYTMVLYRTFDFPVGTFNGDLLAEVGFSNSGTKADNLFSRTLFKNGLGNPTTITVSNTQILRVKYELTVTFDTDTSWKAGSFNITGIGTVGYQKRFQSLTCRYHTPGGSFNLPIFTTISSNGATTYIDIIGMSGDCGLLAYSTSLYSNISQLPSVGTYLNNVGGESVYYPNAPFGTKVTTSTFTSLNWQADYTFKYDVSLANYDISCFVFTYNGGVRGVQAGGWIFYLDTPITKDSLHELTVTVRVTWGRV